MVRKPGFSGARLELARAYYDVGDNELARTEFERLLQENPPANVRETVANYIASIETKALSYMASSQYSVDIGLGYDSNSPAATDDNQFLNFMLNSENLEQNSSFGQITVGALWSKPRPAQAQLLINSSLMHRSNPSTHFVDPSSANVGLAWAWQRGAHMANIGATVTASYLGGTSNKQDYAVNASHIYKMNDEWRFSSFLRYGTLRFEDQLEIQDVDQLMFGLGVEQISQNSMLNVTFLGTQDEEQVTGSNFGNDGFGLQASNTWYSGAGNRVFLALSASTTQYDQPFFGLDRDDDLFSISLGHSRVRFASRDWTLTFQVNYSEKRSTVDLYEYDRWEAGLSLRKVFN